MVDVLLILDGASEPLRGDEPTSLELARTPALDRLAREGELTRLRTIAPGLAPGSEVAIPALLGWTPTAPVDRAALEAAAYGIEVREGERAWRIDVLAAAPGLPLAVARGAEAAVVRGAEVAPQRAVVGGAEDARRRAVARSAEDAPQRAVARGAEVAAEGRAEGVNRAAEVAMAGAIVSLLGGAPGHVVHRLAGHRLLLVGPRPLPAAALAPELRVWPEGVVPPAILGLDTVLVGARGAAVGAARLMGAATVVPAGATGQPASDLAAKARAAIAAMQNGAVRVVVHVGGPDEAAHLCDRTAKVAAIERADRELVGPLAEAVRRARGTLTVCPDHGCDPQNGMHDAAAVPCVAWSPSDATLRRELERAFDAPQLRLTERAVAHLPEWVLPSRAGRKRGVRAETAGVAA